MHSLRKSSLRYLFRHPWQFGLSVLGIAMGVAIVVSIDVANYSSSRAFNLSMDAVAGKATHQIIGPSSGIPDSLYTGLRVTHGLGNIAPVIETYVIVPDTTRRVFRLMGVDFFAERPFRSYLSETGFSIDGALTDFLTQPNSVVLTESNLERLNIRLNDSLTVRVNGKQKSLLPIGVINAKDVNRAALENLLITDIATAQELTEKRQTIDYIDVILENEEQKQHLESLLPEGYILQPSEVRSRTAGQMLEAFNINLNALSLLALIVGIFLIYNTMTFSVVQRRVLIGTIRSVGVTASEISRLIIWEALFIGVLGTIVGFGLGFLISRALILLVSQTINDLYFVVTVREMYISPLIIFKGTALGILATLFSAFKPAREAATVHPRSAMIRSELESVVINKIPVLSVTGVLSILLGTAILLLPQQNIWVSYFGILPIIIGFALLTPLVIVGVEKVASPIFRRLFGITGKTASRSILQNISRTYVAIAALALAVAATVGVGTMISSFRTTVAQWLEARLDADIFISAPSLISRSNDVVLSADILERIRKLEGIAEVNFFRELRFFQDGERYHMLASGLSRQSYEGFRFKSGDPDEVWPAYEEGELLISEPFAYRHGLEPGSILRLKTDRGMRDFKVAGIYYDYASDQGFINIDYDIFREYWDAEGLSGISTFLEEGYSIEEVKENIQRMDSGGQELLVRSYKYLLDSSIEIFDRTFLIANVLQILSVIVAFIGILSALMSLQLERKRELGILRANGLLPSQLFKMVTLQTLLMGITAGLLALPLGKVLAAILVYIINKRSFGWTMQFEIIPSIMLEAVILAVVAAVLAGLYPGYKMSKSSPSLALREE